MVRYLILGLFFLGVILKSNAQNFEWTKVYGGLQSDILRKLCQTGSRNYSYAYISTLDDINFKKATITLDTFTLSKNQLIADCIAKFDTAGKVIWAKQIFEPGSIVSTKIISDNYDNLYLLGSIYRPSDSVRFDASMSYIKLLTGEFSKTFLIKLDSLGNFIWQKEFPNVMERSNSLNLIDDNLYLSLEKDTKSKYFISGTDTIRDRGVIIKLYSSGKKIYAKAMGRGNDYYTNGELFKVKDSIIFFLQHWNSNYKINNDSIQLKYSNKNMAHILKVALNETNNKSKISQITSDGGAEFSLNAISKINDRQFALSGAFRDSFPFKNYKKILFPNSNISMSNTVFIVKDNGVKSHFNLKYSPNMSGGQFLICSSKGQFIYVGGTSTGDFDIYGTKSKRKDGMNVFCKLDTLCNPLWLFRTGDSTSSFNPSGFLFDNYRGVYFGTTFRKTISIDGSVLNSSNNSNDFILSKIFDYSITRGNVSKGPYCAGDTLFTPYTKEGKFDTSNFFIVQLSDKNGDFDIYYRELGRLKSNSDGTIESILPLFDVESSPNYRIRIVSTSPEVQSYYRLDSLRLLIYSKDTANAGKDTTICKGQRVKLTTTGGSRWRWSPGNLVQDSTAKTTVAMPLVTTKYRIIISDSSGCGKIDTAYKTIMVRPPLEITGLPKDTAICKDSRPIFKLIPSGGLGSGFTYQWLSSFNQPLGTKDTLSIKVSTPGRIKAILSDGCTIMNDTVFINFGFPISNFSQLLKDTLVCKNSEPILKLMPSKGLSSDYSYQWFSDFKLLATTDTLRYKISKPETFKAILIHTCSGKQDTSFIKLTLPPLIAAKIEKPECFDSSVTLKITGAGGYKNSLIYIWYKDNKAIDIGKTTTLSSITKKQWIEAYTTDFCKTTVKDSIQLFPNPIAKLLASTDSVCQFQPIVLFNQSVQFNPIQSALNGFRWKNKDTSLTFTKTGQQIISLQITDSLGCKSNASVSLMVIEKPNAEFVIIPENPTVDNGTIELTPLENIYKKYNWAIGENLRLYHKSWQSVRLPILDTATYQATLTVSNSFGCADTVTKLIKIGVSDAFYIPNAVSNNEDGLNDEFAPFGWKVQSYTTLVVARTNQVVYKGNSPWKPTYEDGVYSYVIKVKFKDGTENTFKGHVHVIH